MTDDALASELALATVAVLKDAGRTLDVNWDRETFDVLVPGGEPITGVVLSSSRSVVFYAVHPDVVPADARERTALAATRLNTRLSTSAVELDLDLGLLSVRAGIEVGTASLPFTVLRALLVNALDETERAWDAVRPALDKVVAGDLPADRVLDAWVD